MQCIVFSRTTNNGIVTTHPLAKISIPSKVTGNDEVQRVIATKLANNPMFPYPRIVNGESTVPALTRMLVSARYGVGMKPYKHLLKQFRFQKLRLWAIFWNNPEDRLVNLQRIASEWGDIREPKRHSPPSLVDQILASERGGKEFSREFLEVLANGF
jgi:hypothetical protein